MRFVGSPAHIEAVHAGEHEVKHHHVGVLFAMQRDRLRTIERDQNAEPSLSNRARTASAIASSSSTTSTV